MARIGITSAVLFVVLLLSCQKDDDTPAQIYPGHGAGLLQWPPWLRIVEGVDTTELTTGPWQLTTECVIEPSGVPDYWYAMHEVVMTHVAAPTEQWRLDFIGLFHTTTGTGPTDEQCASIVDLGTFSAGRWDWDSLNSVYNIEEGIRIRYIDSAGATYTTDTSATGEVTEIAVGPTWAPRLAWFVLDGVMSGAMGQRTCLYHGPVLLQ